MSAREAAEELLTDLGAYRSRKAAWTVPTPLTDNPRPAMSLESIPEPVRSYVSAISTATQTPIEMALMTLLPAFTYCYSRRFGIRITDAWLEQTQLWMMPLAASGNRKSAVVRYALAPLGEIQRDEAIRVSKLKRQRDSDRRAAEKGIAQIEQKLAKVSPGSDAELGLRAERQAFIDRIESLPEIHVPTINVDDVTTERMVISLQHSDERVAVVSAEGGILENIAGVYSKGNVRVDAYLKGYSGDSIYQERVGRDPVYVEHPAISMALIVQPDIALTMGRDKRLLNRGLPQRFLFGHTEMPLKANEVLDPPAVPESIQAALNQTMKLLYNERPRHGGREIQLSNLSRENFDELRQEINRRMDPGGELFECREWASKLAGNTARVAAAFHAARLASEGKAPDATPIDGQIMYDAAVLSLDYFIPHALAVFDLMGANPRLELAKRILNLLKRERRDTWTKRDVHNRLGSGITSDDIVPALAHLEDLGYIRTVEDSGSTQRKPGPRSITFEVNPAVYGGPFQEDSTDAA